MHDTYGFTILTLYNDLTFFVNYVYPPSMTSQLYHSMLPTRNSFL